MIALYSCDRYVLFQYFDPQSMQPSPTNSSGIEKMTVEKKIVDGYYRLGGTLEKTLIGSGLNEM